MAFVQYPIFTGETQDIVADASSLQTGTTACSIDSTAARIHTGTRCIKFPLATNEQRAIILCGQSNSTTTFTSMVQGSTSSKDGIFVFSGVFGVSAQPGTGQIAILSDGVQGTTKRYIRIGDTGGTDTKLRLYDLSGNQIGPASTTAISMSGMTEVAVVYDSIYHMRGTGTSATVFIKVYIDGVEEIAFDSGLTFAQIFTMAGLPYFGEYTAAATNRGADLYGDNMTIRSSITLGDSPHLAAFPRFKGYGGAAWTPTKEGNSIQWTGVGAATPNTDQNVDDFPHDGDTTGLDCATINFKHLFRWGDGTTSFADVLPDPCTVENVEGRFVHRLTGGGKTGNDYLLRLAGSEVIYYVALTPGTSFVGNLCEPTFGTDRPGGGTWTREDFDLENGTSTATDATTMTDSGATWDINGFAGLALLCGASTATITSNTGTVITHGGWTGGTPSAASAYIVACSKLQFGVQSSASATVSCRVTSIPGPVVTVYTASLPLGSSPPISATLMTRRNRHVPPQPMQFKPFVRQPYMGVFAQPIVVGTRRRYGAII